MEKREDIWRTKARPECNSWTEPIFDPENYRTFDVVVGPNVTDLELRYFLFEPGKSEGLQIYEVFNGSSDAKKAQDADIKANAGSGTMMQGENADGTDPLSDKGRWVAMEVNNAHNVLETEPVDKSEQILPKNEQILPKTVVGDEEYSKNHALKKASSADSASGKSETGQTSANDQLRSQWNDRVRLQAGDEIIMFNGCLMVKDLPSVKELCQILDGKPSPLLNPNIAPGGAGSAMFSKLKFFKMNATIIQNTRQYIRMSLVTEII